MSPSWTSKSRPRVIGVGALPLQNEADVSSYPSGRISEKEWVVKSQKIFYTFADPQNLMLVVPLI